MGRGHVQGSDWSEAELAEAEKGWRDGLSAGQISDILTRMGTERTRNAVLGMMARQRDRFPRRTLAARRHAATGRVTVVRGDTWTEDQVAKARRLWAAGATMDMIGAAIGRTHAGVRAYIRMHRGLFPERPAAAQTGAPRRGAGGPAQTSGPKPVAATAKPDLAALYPPPPAAPDCRPVTLAARRDDQCAFPLWEHYGAKPTAESLYCGGHVAGDGRYCAYHRALMYQPRAAQATAKPGKQSAATVFSQAGPRSTSIEGGRAA